jgi:hypothetical protein
LDLGETMSRYAIVDSQNNVLNITEWDGESDWSPPEGTTLVQCDDETDAERGGTYIDGAFARAVVEVPSAETETSLPEKIAALQEQLSELASQVSS